jgi:uncharacterized YccA/Bax inhibitor family protein
MASASEVSTIIQNILSVGEEILTGLEAVDPALGLPAELITAIGGLATTALTAFQAASGEAITAASVEALLPAPLPAPPAA